MSVASATAILAPATIAVPSCSFHASRPVRGLDEFFENQQPKHVGRSWECSELRNKSFDDLRKIWFVLLKERNMLETYRGLARQTGTPIKQFHRFSLVRKSMANIKAVVAERNHEYKMLNHDGYRRKCVRNRKERLLADAKEQWSKPPVTRVMNLNPNSPAIRRKHKWDHLTPRPVVAAEPHA